MFWWLILVKIMTYIFFQINFPSRTFPSVETVYVQDDKPKISPNSSPPKESNSSGAAFHKVCFVSSFEHE